MSNAARWPCPALCPGGWGAASAAPSTHPAKSSAAAAAPARPGVCADADHQGAGSHVAGLAAAWLARVTVFGRVGASTNSARTSTFIIGRMPAGDIAVQDVVRAPHPVWASKTETAVKLRAHIGGGAVTGRCRGASSRAIGLATLRHAGTAPGGAFAQGRPRSRSWAPIGLSRSAKQRRGARTCASVAARRRARLSFRRGSGHDLGGGGFGRAAVEYPWAIRQFLAGVSRGLHAAAFSCWAVAVALPPMPIFR